MKQGGYHRGGIFQRNSAIDRGGFTIVETMVVLIVTSALFAMVAVAVSGRQAKTQFTVAINSLQQQFQQTINEAASGYYPRMSDFICTENYGNGPHITPSASNGQGTNGDCIFLGKVVYFGPANPADKYTVFSVVGNRRNNSVPKTDVQDYGPTEANPVMLAGGQTVNPSAPDAYVLNTLSNGLTYKWGRAPINTGHFGLAFLRQLDNAAASGQSGTNQFKLYVFFGSAGWTGPQGLKNVVDGMATTALNPASGPISFCIASGTTNQSGKFTIDESLNVKLQIRNGQVCA